ncbi:MULTISPECIES: GNAT family N-acetyltransferase [Chryseobacterium]|uniref:GNAT family N-acetyltransferase n=1 Tax=Chryseobacterium rhizosphaerae TaxID=395937 RepID=A0ABX9IIV8_9FLAO|nr:MULTISPECIES: GNAT family N-acetyltransferase [Chryseobacterium]MBL3549179.1 GNAT family N-acetyltransferase [Chryseobacterium sp. KMC2]MDC8100447.1 GNAT family N-acetyltransferase [Chryseobacterium rhizosphaerae]MDR6545698.1 N-acetylglutamate synthase-like GNAT family acetyltransferase [Chryseobacterium rhizosphaerae]REC74546.1 GNAT family N-acetyltransferase [Chryseobacterium rhizosphaerae]SMC38400.1 Acetyltransferase (GNAT) family protein [Chryseobacterium sp. YR221]
MKLQIHPIGNSYSEQAIDLILTIQQKEFNVPLTIHDQPDLFEIESFYTEAGGNFWGAFIDGELVGTIALVKFDERAGAIRKMFVKKEFRGKELNIAQELLEILISFCRENGIDDLYLGTITVLKAAQRFYERNDFEKIEKEKLPAQFPLMGSDDIFYHLNTTL